MASYKCYFSLFLSKENFLGNGILPHLIICFVFSFSLPFLAVAQQNQADHYNPKAYVVKVIMNNNIKIKGLLWKVTSDSVYLKVAGPTFWRDPQFPLEIVGYSAYQVEEIELKRNYRLAKNYLTGFYSGIIGGTIFTLIQPIPSAFVVMTGGFIGSGIGLLGSTSPGNKILIHGDPQNLKKYYPVLNQHSSLVRVIQP